MTPADKKSLNEGLILAIRSGDFEDFEQFLADGADVNARDRWGCAALALAVKDEDMKMAEILVGKGADTTVVDSRGNTLLICAADLDKPDMTLALLGWGANPNICNNDGRSPLMQSVFGKNGNTEVMQTLLKAGADPNLRDEHGRTALILAIRYCAVEKTRLLIEAGTDLDAKDNDGVSVEQHAARFGMGKLVADIKKQWEDAKKQAQEEELSVFKKGLSYPIKATKPFKFKRGA